MERNRLTLMTFPMGIDLFKKTMSIRNIFELAQQADVPYVDVMNIPQKHYQLYIDAIRETGVKVYTYITTISFLGSKRKRDKSIMDSLKTAKLLGATFLMIVPYGFLDVYRVKKIERCEVKRRMIEGFQKAVEIGKKFDIRVCFETTPHDASCLSGTQDCLDVLNEVEGLEFVFDTANMLPHGDDPMEAYDQLKDRISHVHLKDVILESQAKISKHAEHTPDGKVMRCVVWGRGIIPIHEIYQRMITDGYTGKFAIEYVHPEGKYDLDGHVTQLNKFFCLDEEHV